MKSIYRRYGIAINKKTSCASCEIDHKFNWNNMRQWCPHCLSYICKKCTPDKKCPRCENPIKERLTNTFNAILFILVILCFLFGGALFVYTSNLDYSALDVEDISSAREGERIKIFGVINSTEDIAIKGTYEGEDDRWLWMPQSFYVEDESGRIWVDNGHYWLVRTTRIRPGSHPQKQYWNGDRICVIGTVQNHTTRGLSLKSDYIAQKPGDFSGLDILWVYLLGFGTILFILLALYVWADLLSRRQQHMDNFANFSPKRRDGRTSRKASIVELMQKKIRRKTVKEKWVAFNYKETIVLGLIGMAILVFVVVFTAVLLYTAFGSPASQIDWDEVCMCSSLITIGITFLIAIIAIIGLKQEIGEHTLKYSGNLEDVSFEEIEEKFQKLVDDLGLPFSRYQKHPLKGKWEVTYEIPRRCGNITFSYIEGLDYFDMTIKVGRGEREDNEYKEQVRANIEMVFDEYLKAGKH